MLPPGDKITVKEKELSSQDEEKVSRDDSNILETLIGKQMDEW